MSQRQLYSGINIQYPISELILSGEKTIETRTYPIPTEYLGKEVLLIETPGKRGDFKSRIRAIVIFTSCFKYKNKEEFYKDYNKHCVDKNSDWKWEEEKGKWGWHVEVKKILSKPQSLKKRTGIRYSKNISLTL